MLLDQYLEIIDYSPTELSQYRWKCFGDKAIYLDCREDTKFEFAIVVNLKTKLVFYAGVSDFTNDNHYLWIDPAFKDAYIAEAESRNYAYNQVYDDTLYNVLDSEKDWIKKAGAIFQGIEYDNRVTMEIDLPDDLLFYAMLRAHEQDITFNEYLALAIEAVINEENKQTV